MLALLLGARGVQAQHSIHAYIGTGSTHTYGFSVDRGSLPGGEVRRTSTTGGLFDLGLQYRYKRHLFGIEGRLGTVGHSTRFDAFDSKLFTTRAYHSFAGTGLTYSFIMPTRTAGSARINVPAFMLDVAASYNQMSIGSVGAEVQSLRGNFGISATGDYDARGYNSFGFRLGPSLLVNARYNQPWLKLGWQVYAMTAQSTRAYFYFWEKNYSQAYSTRGAFYGSSFFIQFYFLNRGLGGPKSMTVNG